MILKHLSQEVSYSFIEHMWETDPDEILARTHHFKLCSLGPYIWTELMGIQSAREINKLLPA
jgi:hypothetical protein